MQIIQNIIMQHHLAVVLWGITSPVGSCTVRHYITSWQLYCEALHHQLAVELWGITSPVGSCTVRHYITSWQLNCEALHHQLAVELWGITSPVGSCTERHYSIIVFTERHYSIIWQLYWQALWPQLVIAVVLRGTTTSCSEKLKGHQGSQICRIK